MPMTPTLIDFMISFHSSDFTALLFRIIMLLEEDTMIKRAVCLYNCAVLLEGDQRVGQNTARTNDDAGSPVSDQGSSLRL